MQNKKVFSYFKGFGQIGLPSTEAQKWAVMSLIHITPGKTIAP